MSAFILRVRDALHDAAPDWEWNFSSSTDRGEHKFRFVATQKQTGEERTVYLAENVLNRLPLKEIVQGIIQLLPSQLKAIPVDGNESINVCRHYIALRSDYRDELEKVRRLAKRVETGA